jgi:membrane protein YdbS with pleckstrin-like domain
MKSYIVSRLNHNESLLMEARRHWFCLFPAVLELFASILLIGFTGGISQLFASVYMAPTIVKAFLFLLALILVYSAVQSYFAFFSAELGFTDKRLIGKTGLLSVRTLLTPLNKINNAAGYTGFFGRLFNYGSVQIYSSSGQFIYDYIIGHDQFLSALMEQIDEYEKELMGGEADARPSARKPAAADRVPPEPARRGRDTLDLDDAEPAPALAKDKPVSKKPADEPSGRKGGPDKGAPQPQTKGDGAKAPGQISGFCPYCKAPYSVMPEMDGRLYQCKRCKKQFVVKAVESA